MTINSALAFYDAHPLLVWAIVGVVLSIAAKVSAKRFPALSAALYSLAAIAPADLTRAVGNGQVTPEQKAAIEKDLLDRIAYALAYGHIVVAPRPTEPAPPADPPPPAAS